MNPTSRRLCATQKLPQPLSITLAFTATKPLMTRGTSRHTEVAEEFPQCWSWIEGWTPRDWSCRGSSQWRLLQRLHPDLPLVRSKAPFSEVPSRQSDLEL